MIADRAWRCEKNYPLFTLFKLLFIYFKVWTLLQMQVFQSCFYNLTRVVSLHFLVFQKESPPPPATVQSFFLRLVSFKQLQRGTLLSITVIQNKFNWNRRRGHIPANIICPKWCFLCFISWEILANFPQWVSYSSLWSLQFALLMLLLALAENSCVILIMEHL